jgi:hypothetical protein
MWRSMAVDPRVSSSDTGMVKLSVSPLSSGRYSRKQLRATLHRNMARMMRYVPVTVNVSLIPLQLIRISDNLGRDTKNYLRGWVQTLKHARHLERQAMSDETWRYLQTCIITFKHVQLLCHLSMNDCNALLWFLNKCCTAIFVFIFISTAYIIKFSIYLCSECLYLLGLTFTSLIRICLETEENNANFRIGDRSS